MKQYINQGNLLINKETILKPSDEIWEISASKREITLNNQSIYIKPISLSELIGEQLATSINLRTVNYHLIETYHEKIELCSYNFKKSGYEYRRPKDPILKKKTDKRYIDYCNNISYFLDMCNSKENKEEFLNKLFKLIALDTYSRQTDRVNCNILFEISSNGYLDFAPIFDYADSFDSIPQEKVEEYINSFYYYNPICSINLYEYQYIMDDYPILRQELENIRKIDMKRLLEELSNNHKIILANKEIDNYMNQEELSQKLLEKILK